MGRSQLGQYRYLVLAEHDLHRWSRRMVSMHDHELKTRASCIDRCVVAALRGSEPTDAEAALFAAYAVIEFGRHP
jgi:hypothetical protein